MKSRFFRLFLLRWHRRIGLLLMGFVVMWVCSGIALNHNDDLHLEQRYISQPWLLQHYGISVPALRSFQLGQHWLSGLGGQLFLDATPLLSCEGQLLAAVSYREGIAALCDDLLLLLTSDGAVLDQVDLGRGLPEGATHLAESGGDVYLQAGETYRVDSISLGFDVTAVELSWVGPSAPPAPLRAEILRQYRGEGLSWERLLLDLHSGRILGKAGVYLVDAAAILLLLIALGGVWVWMTKPGRWHKS